MLPSSGSSNRLSGRSIFLRCDTFLATKFDVATPNSVHQADLLFLPHEKPPRGRKIYKYALTVVDVVSRYKEAEPLTSKDCRGCKGFPVDLQTQSFDLASGATG